MQSWYSIARLILRFRTGILVLLVLLTAFMGWKASQVRLSYDFTRAIPTDNARYVEYQAFRQQFGDDGNTLVAGFNSQAFFTPPVFNEAAELHARLRKVPGVENVLDVSAAVGLEPDSSGHLSAVTLFGPSYHSGASLDSAASRFRQLPFYQGLLYNPRTRAFLVAIRLNKDSINSASRTRLVSGVTAELVRFSKLTGLPVHLSGLPFVRTVLADRIRSEMGWFLGGSIVLSAITLLLFFRSFSATLLSLAVVGIGVTCSLASMVLFGFKITLLTALIAPLIVVIGVPNCIYFLNKFHSAWRATGDKREALVQMVGRMGIVTLFCNVAAATGFAVFALTRSDLLKEFGLVAGVNIMGLFFISLLLIPAALSFLPAPGEAQLRYLDNRLIERWLLWLERVSLQHRGWVFGITAALIVIAAGGIAQLKSEGYIVDDLPKNDPVYTDLKWFEQNFGGVMPLEIVIDTRHRRGLTRSLRPMEKIDSFCTWITTLPEAGRPLSLSEGLKFARQGFYQADSSGYLLPGGLEAPLLAKAIARDGKAGAAPDGFSQLVKSFTDTAGRLARISVNMKDIGSRRLPGFLDTMERKAAQTFDTASYKVTFTGTSVTFLEGTRFIIRGLRDSVLWAFLLIALCMLYLFRSLRMLVCSLVPNLVPLVLTAGVMGWAGIPLKPSTVLVFSVALGIVIDVTIRFLVNYKQELPLHRGNVDHTLSQTIRHTGLSILYTSLVLVAGFVIFCFSRFGGTRALGWLTSFTLVTGTLTNLTLLPVMIGLVSRKKSAKRA